jgi:hypothetical protein
MEELTRIDKSSLVDRVEAKLVELLQVRNLKNCDSIPTEL